MRITAKEIAIATGGQITGCVGTAAVTGVSTDSRGICEDCLFVPLVGANFDGHDFIGDALAKGAKVVLTSRHQGGGSVDGGSIGSIIGGKGGNVGNDNGGGSDGAVFIEVADTLEALGKLAAWYRLKFNPLVIGVTGSVGKTTTKEMIALVLAKKFNVLKSMGNRNNEIGLPLSIFDLTGEHTALVLELGMSSPGEISRLSKIARPDVAVITNIGDAHIKQFGTKQNILKAKLEILEGMSKNGTVYLNGDDTLLKGLTGLIDRPVVYYGIDENLDVTGTGARMKGERGIEFEFTWQEKIYSVTLNAAGAHNIHNALAAVSIGLQYGISPKQIIDALYEFQPDKLRMNVVELGGIRMINDAYNANPQSMRAAIDVLSELPGGGRRVAVLGDMLELGDYAQQHHMEIGAYLAGRGVDVLVAVGAFAGDVASGASDGGVHIVDATTGAGSGGGGNIGVDAHNVDCHTFADQKDAVAYILSALREGDVVLVKGSRGMYMEQVAGAIEGAYGA